MHLVIGGDGTIGTALCAELRKREIKFIATSRRISLENRFQLDLRNAATADLPPMAEDGVVYLVAAVAGFGRCQTNPDAWRVNVDGPIRLAERLWRCFFVFISSDVVEMPGSDTYQMQKRQAEMYFRQTGGMIIRPARVTSSYYAAELAKVIVDEGLARKPGGLRWPSLERF